MARTRRVLISPEKLAQLAVTGSCFKCIEGFPENCKVVGSGFDIQTNGFVIFIEHEKFEELGDGFVVPIHSIASFEKA